MQFSLKHLFLAMLVVALSTIAVQLAIDFLTIASKFWVQLGPYVHGPTLLILAAPALLGIGILSFSTFMFFRTKEAKTKLIYKNLAAIGFFAIFQLAVYFVSCCIIATNRFQSIFP